MLVPLYSPIVSAIGDVVDNAKAYDPIATSHTEGGESFLHSYVTLTLRYRWDPKR